MSKRTRTQMPEQNPAEKLQAMIVQEQQARAQACLVELAAVLKRHNCEMKAEMILSNGRVEGRVNIVAMPKDPQ